jgi:hypothetical protein
MYRLIIVGEKHCRRRAVEGIGGRGASSRRSVGNLMTWKRVESGADPCHCFQPSRRTSDRRPSPQFHRGISQEHEPCGER